MLAGIEAEQAEVDLDVAVGRLQTAERQDTLAREAQWTAIGREAREFQRAISLDGGADVGRTAAIDVEAAIRQLALEDGVRGPFDARACGWKPRRALGLVHPELQQNVVGFEGAVGSQFAAPEALGRLAGKQISGRPRGGVGE